jgi:Methyltransferase FkbM domain
LIVLYGIPKFIKIDVEGYEFKVLQGLRQPVPNLSFEVNLPEFRAEGQQCVQFLGKLEPKGKFNYAVECEQGLALERWLSADEFLPALERCGDQSIEVFWKGLTPETV